jgi:hypothetical protein
MAEADASPSTTTVTDVDVDSLAHCATYLSFQDLSNLAMSCNTSNASPIPTPSGSAGSGLSIFFKSFVFFFKKKIEVICF